jgi:hypothetical protein
VQAESNAKRQKILLSFFLSSLLSSLAIALLIS